MGAIILVGSTRFVRRHALFEATAVQAAVTVALMPLTLAAFGSLSLIGPLVNAAAIPAMSWVFVPVILLSIVLRPLWPQAGDAMLAVAAWMHHVGWPWLAAAADLPWALAHASPPSWWYVVAAVGTLLSLLPLPLSLRLAAILWLVPLGFAASEGPENGRARITVLDVGEGTAVVVQTAHHVLVYDTGDVYGSDGRAAESVLVPYLRSLGLRAIDKLVVSDRKSFGSAGITAVLAELPARKTLAGPAEAADFEGARPCDAEAWMWDEVAFRVIPTDASVSGAEDARTCLLRVETRHGRVLLPGEIDARAERRLAALTPLAADIVIVPRHGSDSASTPDFIRAVSARWAVVSGRRTRDGRLKPAIARWEQNGATVVATADLGAIRFDVGQEQTSAAPGGERAARPRLWRLP
jgi:competence protein ComEC